MGRGLALAFMLLALVGAGLAFVKPFGLPRAELIRLQHDRVAAERAALDKSLLAVKADLARMTTEKAEVERLAGLERDQAARKLADLQTHMKGVMARAVDAERALAAAGIAAKAELEAVRRAAKAELDETRQASKTELEAARQTAKVELDAARQEISRLTAARDELATQLAALKTESEKALAAARDDAARARTGRPDAAAEAAFEKRLAAARTEAAERFMAARNEADRQITAAQADTAKCRAELEKASAKPPEAPAPACPAAATGDPVLPPNTVIPAAQIAQHLETDGHISLYVPFDSGSADVKPNALPSIEPIAEVLRQDPKLKLLLVGHTDSKGDFGFNRNLSEKRAKAIVDQLIAKHGIDRGRLAYAGVADLAPIATNDTDAGRLRNRRVEVIRR